MLNRPVRKLKHLSSHPTPMEEKKEREKLKTQHSEKDIFKKQIYREEQKKEVSESQLG